MHGFNQDDRQGVGKPITARRINALIAAVAGLLKMNVGRGLALSWINGAPQIRATGDDGRPRHAKTGGSGITAATSVTQMTSGTVALWTASATGALTAVTGSSVTAWNKSTTAVAANTHVLIQTDENGLEIVVWEMCGA